MKMAPSGAFSVLGVNILSASCDLGGCEGCVADDFVGGGLGGVRSIGLRIRAYPKYCPDLLAEKIRYTSSAVCVMSDELNR